MLGNAIASPLRICVLILAAALPQGLVAQGLPPSDAARALADLARATPTAGPSRTDRVNRTPNRPVAPMQFAVSQIDFTAPSGYLDAPTLQAIAAPFIGTRLTRKQTERIASAFNAAYAAREISLAQARIAAINPRTGRVTVDLFEARLGEVAYDAVALSPRYLDMRLGLASGDLADTGLIAERLERLALSDGLRSDANFSPGAANGSTDLTIALSPPPRFEGNVRLDNYGEASRGRARGILSLRVNNLTGWNDPLAFDLFATEGTLGGSLAYARRITPGGGTLGLRLSHDRSPERVGGIPGSSSASGAISFAIPLVLSVEREISAFVEAEAFRSKGTTVGVATTDQKGTSLSFGLSTRNSYPSRNFRQIAGSLALRVGRYDDGITGARDLSFAAISGNLRADWVLGKWGLLTGTVAGQLSRDGNLPGRFDFAVTSPFAVPGYPEGLSEGASGWSFRLQLEAQNRLAISGSALRPYVFVAAGQAYDWTGTGWGGQGLAQAAGIGLNGKIRERLILDAQVARSMRAVLGEAEGLEVRASLAFKF